jgi:hypothetical protein
MLVAAEESLGVCWLQGKGYFSFACPIGVSRGAWELLWMFYSRASAADSVTVQLKRLWITDPASCW